MHHSVDLQMNTRSIQTVIFIRLKSTYSQSDLSNDTPLDPITQNLFLSQLKPIISITMNVINLKPIP